MAEIKIKFDLTFTRRFVTYVTAAAMMLCAVPELDSESVTLSTYYPAPSGVYTNMITTGNTYLARDAGFVGIGTATPDTKLKLPSGEIGIGQQNDSTGYMRMGMDTGWVQYVANNGYWDSAASNYKYVNTGGYGGLASRMYQVSGTIGFDTASGGTTPLTWVNRIVIGNNGNVSLPVNSTLDATGPMMSRQGPTCSDISYNYPTPGGGTQALCAGGNYVTAVDGVYTKKYILAGVTFTNTNPTVTARCCPCPASGCPL